MIYLIFVITLINESIMVILKIIKNHSSDNFKKARTTLT